jgi:hypothetical protein
MLQPTTISQGSEDLGFRELTKMEYQVHHGKCLVVKIVTINGPIAPPTL